jgi:predicted CXXCH cytochrome family protein
MHWFDSRSWLAVLVGVVLSTAAPARAQPEPAKKAEPAASAKPAPTAKPAASAANADAEAEAGPKHGRPERDANTCVTCHLSLPDQKLRIVAEQYSHSVHRDERIGCAGCHKGNPTDPTVQAHDKNAGFVARPAHNEIAGICGGCHEDPTFVRRFNARLPTDQKKLYDLSAHGRIASAGDDKAPTCSDCHGTHGIAPVASPDAPVNRRRVVDLCKKCHADKTYMAPYGLHTDQADQWTRSVHGLAFAAGSDVAPTCTGCHSPHAGTLPGTQSITALCDRCHQDERDLFLKSPHARAFRERGLAECVPCHGDHNVARSNWLAGMSADSACSKCHSQSDKPRRVAEEIAKLMGSVNDAEHTAEIDLTRAKAEGLYVPDAAFALDKLRTAKQKLRASVHTLDVARITEEVAEVKPIAEEAHSLIQKAENDRRIERRGYYAAILTAGLLFILLVVKALELTRRRSRSPS